MSKSMLFLFKKVAVVVEEEEDGASVEEVVGVILQTDSSVVERPRIFHSW
jgi:hypothetical protein